MSTLSTSQNQSKTKDISSFKTNKQTKTQKNQLHKQPHKEHKQFMRKTVSSNKIIT